MFLCRKADAGCTRARSWATVILSPGASSTPRRVGASHKDGNVYLLSSILMDNVPERFSLSPKACQGILRRAEKRGKELPQVLKAALERSAEYFAVATDGTVQVAESFLVPKVEHYNYDYYMGAAYEIDPAAPVGNRIKNLTYQGKTVTETDSFTLCLNNYRYSGAGGYEVYTECELVREINTEMVELILEYFKENPYVEV